MTLHQRKRKAWGKMNFRTFTHTLGTVDLTALLIDLSPFGTSEEGVTGRALAV